MSELFIVYTANVSGVCEKPKYDPEVNNFFYKSKQSFNESLTEPFFLFNKHALWYVCRKKRGQRKYE